MAYKKSKKKYSSKKKTYKKGKVQKYYTVSRGGGRM